MINNLAQKLLNNTATFEERLNLDDCFIELDDNRFEKVMEYLTKNFNNQIIYFTAHKRIFNFTLENSRVVEI